MRCCESSTSSPLDRIAPTRFAAMPELPDITSYLVALRPRIVGQPLEKIVVRSPFLVRTVEPDLFALEGMTVGEVSRLGKRDRKSTRLNSSHGYISYAVFCLKKKNNIP